MLESVKISRRQSEIRQELAALVGKPEPSEDETRSMESLDAEYRQNETRYRASLISEDTERREAGDELETRSDAEYQELIGRFELRQVALLLDEGRQLDGPTAEIVQEMRDKGGYRGLPVPWEALQLEQRAGETIASGVADPIQTRPIIDRLFPASAAARLGAQMISIDHGAIEWPVVTSSVSAGWQTTETGDVAGPTAFQTTDKAMTPNQTFGVTMKVTRRSLKQSGAALEQAIRRDLNSAISAGLDQAAFLGTGSDGQPLGVVIGASTYGITETAINAEATWGAFRSAVVRFLNASAANAPGAVKMLLRPEVWSTMDAALIEGTGISEWDRMLRNIPAGNIVLSPNAAAAPDGSPDSVTALVTTSAGGVAPFFFGTWGGVDLIRDVYTDAASGGLRLTGLVTADVTVARPTQLEVLENIQV